MTTLAERIDETVAQIRDILDTNGANHLLSFPSLAIVCGSGLGGLAKSLRNVVEIPYDALKGFGSSTVPGHKSSLAFGFLGIDAAIPVVAMLGRFHAYEGHSMDTVVYPIRVLARLGVADIIITNASGSLNPSIPVGSIVAIRDHLALPNLTGFNPLLGPQRSPTYPRFLPLSDAYAPSFRRLAFLAAHHLNLPGHALPNEHSEPDTLLEGTYAWVSGPSYESAAEGRFLRNAGADVVGMSTVPEVLAAREERLRVLVLSLVTNFVVIPEHIRNTKDEVEAEILGKSSEVVEIAPVSHDEVLAIGRQRGEVMRQLVEKIAELIQTEVFVDKLSWK